MVLNKLKFYISLCLSCAASPVFSPAVFASDVPPPGLTYLSDDIPSSSVETPSFFKTVIDTGKSENKLKSTQEIVNQTVGVDIDNFGGLGSLSTVSIRGSSSNQVLIMLDGTKLNSPSGQIVDLSSLPVSLAERIEILRGGSSAEYGEGPIGGVINIIPSEGMSKKEGAFSLKAGSFGTTELAVFYRERFSDLHLLTSSSVQDSRGDFKFINPNNTPNNLSDDYQDYRKNNDFTSAGNFTKLSWKFSPCFRASLSNEFYYSTKGIPGTLSFPSNNAYQNDLRNVAALDVYFKGIIKKTDLKLSLSSNVNSLFFRDPFGELTGTVLKTEEMAYKTALDSVFDIYALSFDLITLSMGTELSFLDQTLQGTQNIKPLRGITHWIIKNQIDVWKKYLTLTPIVRLDWVYNSYEGVTDNDLVVSPKLGISSNITNSLKLKSNIGSSYRYPNFSELYFSEGFVEGNPDLETERAINFDLGIKYTKEKIFFAELVYFLNRVEDLIVYEQISNFRYKPLNIGKSVIQGIEFTAGVYPASFLKLTLNNTFLDPRNKTEDPNKNGKLLPGRPQSKTNVRLSFIGSPLDVYGEFQVVSANYINEANTVKLGGRYLLNCGVSYSYKVVTLNLDIKNLLNDQIEDVRGFPLPGFSFMSGITLKL